MQIDCWRWSQPSNEQNMPSKVVTGGDGLAAWRESDMALCTLRPRSLARGDGRARSLGAALQPLG